MVYGNWYTIYMVLWYIIYGKDTLLFVCDDSMSENPIHILAFAYLKVDCTAGDLQQEVSKASVCLDATCNPCCTW